MKNAFKGITSTVIILSILSIILGILMIVYPGASLDVFATVIAIFLIVQGLALIFLDVKAWRLYIPFDGLLPGILCAIVGVLLLFNPETFKVYFGIIVGIWILVSGFSGIKQGYSLRFIGAPWLLIVLLNVVDVILGILMIFSPVATSISATIALGIILIYHAVNTLVYMIIIKKNAKDAENLIKEKFPLLGKK